MIDNLIIPIITIPHTGTHSIVKAIDPDGSDTLRKLSEKGKLTKEVFEKTEYNYVLLEGLSSGWNEFKASGKKLIEHRLIDSDRKNLIFGHIVCYNQAYAETLNCIEELSRNSRIIMPMRDPLLTLISNLVRTQSKRIVSITDLGDSSLSQIQVWMRENLYQLTRNYSVVGHPSFQARSSQNIIGSKKHLRKNIKVDKFSDNVSIIDFLNSSTKKGRHFTPGSEHIGASNCEMRGFLFMWELWAKHIHKLNPYYIHMDLDKDREGYPGVDLTNIGKHNVSKTRPLKEAYYNKDLFNIAKELEDNLRALMDMEYILRPTLEDLGYRNLLWWDTNIL